ncbi:MAG: hypothetical protein AAFX81_18230 [Pseudomonadota bacterium]
MAKVIFMQALSRRLRNVLADRPHVASLFERALVERDDHALAEAFELLQAAPNESRLAVEAVILDWLFGEERLGPTDPLSELERSKATHH